MPTVYLGLGSNLGDKKKHIRQALALITERVGENLALSRFYETQPWGYNSKKSYQNVAVEVKTTLTPSDLLVITQEIEQIVGRRRKTINGQYEDREIDIDILLYDDLIIDTPTLTIPHPLMHQRPFVLQPLAEIAPHVIHPVLQKKIAAI